MKHVPRTTHARSLYSNRPPSPVESTYRLQLIGYAIELILGKVGAQCTKKFLRVSPYASRGDRQRRCINRRYHASVSRAAGSSSAIVGASTSSPFCFSSC